MIDGQEIMDVSKNFEYTNYCYSMTLDNGVKVLS